MTRLVADPERGTKAVGTGEFVEYPVQMVLKSIGYKSLPIDGVPFDSKQGIVPNSAGRVLTGVNAQKDSVVPGLYVCGWLKRGPTGIIGTNLTDAEETFNSLAQDYLSLQPAAAGTAGSGLKQLLQRRGKHVVDHRAWERLNSYEVQQGEKEGSARIKCVSLDDMLRVAHPR
eukprot:GHUV01050276.1.p1 GENE.GHUV01050276.1~~GHUV01050276.1.p1  ORF type:complete len:172 (+),score=56.42 GHUV01050276.1:291-806(+)